MSEVKATSNMTTHSVSLNIGGSNPTPEQKLVKVLIGYPEDYGKPKFFKDGDIKEVSQETAETFIATGIATLHIEESVEAPVAEQLNENTPPENGDIKEVSQETAGEKKTGNGKGKK